MKNIFYFLILLLTVNAFALPIGDPRTPDTQTRSQIETSVSQGMHELSVHAFMGASKIDYPEAGGTKFSPGFGAAITYSYFFFPNWSFMVGGGLQLFNNRGTNVSKNFSDTLTTNDYSDPDELSSGNEITGKVFLLYDVKDYEETQWSLMLMVPIMLQYQSNESRNKAFYYAMGLKLGFPFAGAYEGKAKSTNIIGCYPDFLPCDEPYPASTENFPSYYSDSRNLGFGEFKNKSSYKKLELGTAFFAAFEAGVKWRLYNKLAVYTGFWMDWALNDVAMQIAGERDLEWYPTGCPANGCLQEEEQKEPRADIEYKSRTKGKAIPVSMGFAVRFAFGAGDRYAPPDSIRWMREIQIRDSLLAVYRERNKAVEDSLAYTLEYTELLLDSLEKCRTICQVPPYSKEDIRKQIDADIEARILADLMRARQDSIAKAEQMEKEKAARLADFRNKLASLRNGLDDYKVTQTVPSEHAREKLDIAAELMRDYPDLRIRITGHTCNKGTHEANVRFGMQRAESARNYLIAKGINKNRMEINSKAEEEPVVPNDSEENRRKNRRVQLEILEGGDGIIVEEK